MTRTDASEFHVRLARSPEDLRAAQRLRYDVFVTELGGDGALVDHENRLEQDHLDPFFDHLLLFGDDNETVIGVYRLMQQRAAKEAGGFYSASEYDLSPLVASGRRILELGRSCLHPDFRGGTAMHHLWTGLAQYVAEHQIEILFGVASFHGTDAQKLAQPLSLLHHRHLAPPALRVKALPKHFQSMDLIANSDLDRRAAMVQVPSLIKAYLRLGGFVGEGAAIDHDFNTTDVFLVMDTDKLSGRQARIYGGQGR